MTARNTTSTTRKKREALRLQIRECRRMHGDDGSVVFTLDRAEKWLDDADDRDTLAAEVAGRDAEVASLRAEVERRRSHDREIAQVLIEEVGADGPMDAIDAARRVVATVARLRADLAAANEAHVADAAELGKLLAKAADDLAAATEHAERAEAALVRHQTEPDPGDPDGWIRRSALNHWRDRADTAEARVALLEAALRLCAARAGLPDAAEACRAVVATVDDALAVKES